MRCSEEQMLYQSNKLMVFSFLPKYVHFILKKMAIFCILKMFRRLKESYVLF